MLKRVVGIVLRYYFVIKVKLREQFFLFFFYLRNLLEKIAKNNKKYLHFIDFYCIIMNVWHALMCKVADTPG